MKEYRKFEVLGSLVQREVGLVVVTGERNGYFHTSESRLDEVIDGIRTVFSGSQKSETYQSVRVAPDGIFQRPIVRNSIGRCPFYEQTVEKRSQGTEANLLDTEAVHFL